ncbi:MAG TPA: hypothetical protein VI386_07625, partial [Candidatus Sulfotelmatobacter sp.]
AGSTETGSGWGTARERVGWGRESGGLPSNFLKDAIQNPLGRDVREGTHQTLLTWSAAILD